MARAAIKNVENIFPHSIVINKNTAKVCRKTKWPLVAASVQWGKVPRFKIWAWGHHRLGYIIKL